MIPEILLEPSHIVSRNIYSTAALKNRFAVPQKVKCRTITWPSDSLPDIHPREMRAYTHTKTLNEHSQQESFQVKKWEQSKLTDKQNVGCTYNGILFGNKKKQSTTHC